MRSTIYQISVRVKERPYDKPHPPQSLLSFSPRTSVKIRSAAVPLPPRGRLLVVSLDDEVYHTDAFPLTLAATYRLQILLNFNKFILTCNIFHVIMKAT